MATKSISVPLNPLAFPKGTKMQCELCQKTALMMCKNCRVTFYCSREHQDTDWVGIHEKICQSLIPLRTPAPVLTSEEEREAKRQELIQLRRNLLDMTRTVGRKFLFEGRYDYSIPAAMQSLRFAIDIFGLSSIELVPSYLILAEASIGLGRIPQADEYLAQAQWTVLKTPNCGNEIRSDLNRILGLLNDAKGDYSGAIKSLANDICYASEQHGPDSVKTATGYFYMAMVFEKLDEWKVADSLYRRVFNIWFEFLLSIFKQRVATVHVPDGIGSAVAELTQKELDKLAKFKDEAQEAEVSKVLNTLEFVYRSQRDNEVPQDSSFVDENSPVHQVHVFMAKLYLGLAMLCYVLRNTEKCAEYLEEYRRLIIDYLITDPEMEEHYDAMHKTVDRI